MEGSYQSSATLFLEAKTSSFQLLLKVLPTVSSILGTITFLGLPISGTNLKEIHDGRN